MGAGNVLANPVKSIAQGGPHVIHNDEELEVYTEELFKLTALENPSRDEEEAIELLDLLIAQYNQRHYPLPKARPTSVVRFLLEHNDLTQNDLIPEFGSKSAVSMFLSGQRSLTLEQIRKLSARFHVSPEAFMHEAKRVVATHRKARITGRVAARRIVKKH
jgi:HTH-type transcriptional regulator / antitoxin HigA